MNALTTERLDNYWKRCKRKKRYSERLAVKASLIFSSGCRKQFFLYEVLDVARMLFYCRLGLLFEFVENAHRRVNLSKILGMRKDEIAMVLCQDLVQIKMSDSVC